jgi:nucleoside-diphosphate-sugar epimerase
MSVVSLNNSIRNHEESKYRMRIFLTGHRGYIGTVTGSILRSAGHEVTGLGTDGAAGDDFSASTKDSKHYARDHRNH